MSHRSAFGRAFAPRAPRERSAEGPDQPRAAPVGTIAFLTALYCGLYLFWERSDWGTPAVRDLVGNVAFMPLNAAVVVSFALASRNPVLDPRVRRALSLLAIGARWCSSATPSRSAT